MQDISSLILKQTQKGRGGRVSSPLHRQTQELCEDFAGLEENTNRYSLLLLVKRVSKTAGFSPRMIELLDYYMAFTRDIDWEEGARPIVYQSLAKTALDLGVSERHVQRVEQQLFKAGAISWNDSGNHRRYGQRCQESGMILYAYGVDLTPLAYLKADLEQKLHEKQLYDQAWMETKRQISWYRRQVRAILAEAELAEEEGRSQLLEAAEHIKAQSRYDEIACPIRTYMDLEFVRTLLDEHKHLYESLMHQVQDAEKEQKIQKQPDNESKVFQKESSKDDTRVINYKYTNQKQSNKLDTGRDKPNRFQESRNQNSVIKPDRVEQGDIISETGLQHITLKQTLNAAGERFRAHIPIENRAMNWNDIVEAAYKLKTELHISQQFWAESCVTLGRTGAAICVLLTDQATQRKQDPVAKPAAYFKSMISRARTGDLKLHKSIFGILKQEEGAEL